MSLSRVTLLSLALAAVFSVMAAEAADARVGGGRNLGSRGSRTWTAPPATNTAPRAAQPIERSMTQAQPGKPGAVQNAQPQPAGGLASRFGGWRSLLLGGLIGAGLASLFGLGALANVLGFLLQAALIAGIVYLAIAFFRGRSAQPALASAGGGARADSPQPSNAYRQAVPMLGGAGSAVSITPDDYDAFERRLSEIQLAYGRSDLAALGDRVTPEMLSYFAEELDANAKKGVRAEVGEPKLLQGDLAEAWRENGEEYATVAMRYGMTDATVEIATGRVLEGDRERPQEVTEVWTFRRPQGGRPDQWELSAIQQA